MTAEFRNLLRHRRCSGERLRSLSRSDRRLRFAAKERASPGAGRLRYQWHGNAAEQVRAVGVMAENQSE